MIRSGKPFRAIIASFTVMWTGLFCCCAVGYGISTAAAAMPDQPAAHAAPADPHACCQAPANPAEPKSDDTPAGHDCDCSHNGQIKINQSRHQALPPVTFHAPAFDLLPSALLDQIDPPTITLAHPRAHPPPVSPAAQSLHAQCCMLTT